MIVKNNEYRCGGCTLCCKLLKIPQLNKPGGLDCHYCTPGVGCSIWKNHPSDCRDFVCLWHSNPEFPDEFRPDQCGVIFEPGGEKIMLANVDPGRPDIWLQGLARKFIENCLESRITVVIMTGSEKRFLLAEEDTLEKAWERITADARRRGFVE
jgi:hypothetical protein